MKAILCAFLAALFYAASSILSFEGGESFRFSHSMPFVLFATVCWGVENKLHSAYIFQKHIRDRDPQWSFFRSGTLAIAFARREPLMKHHTHLHSHIFSHCHDGALHEHIIVHSHAHDHCASMEKHTHKHPLAQLEESVKNRQEQ